MSAIFRLALAAVNLPAVTERPGTNILFMSCYMLIFAKARGPSSPQFATVFLPQRTHSIFKIGGIILPRSASASNTPCNNLTVTETCPSRIRAQVEVSNHVSA